MVASSELLYHTDYGRVIPVRRFLAGTKYDGKNPNRPGWQHEPGLTADEIAALDPEIYNLGLILGPVVDFDADCDEVRVAARYLMPPTQLMFGRGERLDAHRLYLVTDGELAVKPYNDPLGGRLGELRGKGGQTIIPPSVHKSGETLRYERSVGPERIGAAPLARAANWTMAAALLGRYWRDGVRHEAATALAGWLARGGVPEAEALTFVQAAAAVGRDEESRCDTVTLTYRKHREGVQELTGFTTLASILPREVVAAAGKWMDLRALELVPQRAAPDDGDEAFPDNDVENAERLRERLAGGVRYVAVQRQFYVEREGIWRPDGALAVDAAALAMGRDLKARAAADLTLPEKEIKRRLTHARAALSATGTSATLRQLGRLEDVSIGHDRFDAQRHLIACRDGVVDLRAGTLLPFDRDLLLTKRANVGWFRGVPDEKDDLPHWMHYLQSSYIEPDGAPSWEKIFFLQRWLGYCLTGETKEQKFLAMMGQSRSGKGTLARLLEEVIMPDFVKSATASLFLDGAERRHSTDVAGLFGARVVFASEFKADGLIATETVKRMTGGDAITARLVNQNNFTFFPQFKVNIMANEEPRIEEGGSAFWERILKLDYHRTFVVRATEMRPESLEWPLDTSLDAKLASEADAIFAWIVDGARLWYMDGDRGISGLNVPASVAASSLAMRENQDVLGAFVAHSCVVAGAGGDTVEGVFEAWNGYKFLTREKDMPQRQFMAQMILRGYPIEKERNGRQGLWFRTLKVKL